MFRHHHHHHPVSQVHGRIRRYTSPDENAFFPEELPPLVLPPITYDEVGLLGLCRPLAPRCISCVPGLCT